MVIAVKMNTGDEISFDLWAVCDKPSSFTRYLEGSDGGGHVYHKLPERLADFLSGKKCRVVMYDHKMMHALYNTMGMCFIGGELYTGRFGCEPSSDKYCCTDWMLVSKQIFGTALDQDITGTVIMDMPLLETLKIPKTDAICYLLDGKPAALSGISRFHLKTSKPALFAINQMSIRCATILAPKTNTWHKSQARHSALCKQFIMHSAFAACLALLPLSE